MERYGQVHSKSTRSSQVVDLLERRGMLDDRVEEVTRCDFNGCSGGFDPGPPVNGGG